MAAGAQAWLARLWRPLALAAAAFLLHASDPAPQGAPALSLAQARAFFPDASRLKAAPDRSIVALDAFGNRIGRLVTTSPEADGIVGYSGPTNVLVALDNDERVLGIRILSSEDTAAHVAQLKSDPAFAGSFVGWTPRTRPAPKLEGVAGSTLTAYGVAESVQQRLSGTYASLRFPTPLTVEEAKSAGLTDAASLETHSPRRGWHRVKDAGGATLGFLVRTSPSGDEATGYAGPTDTLVSVAPDARTIRKVLIRSTYDTADYVRRVKEDPAYLSSLARWNVEEWASLDFNQARLEGVAGATLTSFAVAEGMRRRFADDRRAAAAEKEERSSWLRRAAAFVLLAGSLAMAFTSLHGRPRVRLVWQLLLVGGTGLWLGQLVSLGLYSGWARHGVPWAAAPELVVLGAVALLIPWAARKQAYCHHVCPHGAAQELLGRFRGLHRPLSGPTHSWLSKLPSWSLAGAFLTALALPSFDLNRVEPFDAWILGVSASIPLGLAVLGLLASVFIPQAYCKYGCPTGALLKFVRTTSSDEGFTRRDGVALALLAVGGVFVLAKPEAALPEPPPPAITEIHGAAFGTTWTVKVRGDGFDADLIKRELEAEASRVEFSLSHWRDSSGTYDFNTRDTTRPFGVTDELMQLVLLGRRLGEATEGDYDLTVAPLLDLWGYGPSGKRPKAPTDEEIAAALPAVGWKNLVTDAGALTIAKRHPRTALDLGSLLQGHAADRLAQILKAEGHDEFLIEVGGELLAAGTWQVGVEDPMNPGRKLDTPELKDRALAVSGLYRARRRLEGRETNHILSPRTGKPVTPTLEMAAVYAPNCVLADGWSTALMAAGFEKAKRIAERERLEVILVTTDGKVWRRGK
jgi:thiamine biosynthesis lipoprotein ApbE